MSALGPNTTERTDLITAVGADSLSREEFAERFLGPEKPVLIRGGLAHTRAFELWSWDHLAEQMASRSVRLLCSRTGVFNPNAGSGMGDVTVVRTSLSEALRRIADGSPDSGYAYVQQLEIPRVNPALADDLPVPVWVGDCGTLRKVNLWLGGAGCVTPLHFDSSHNLLGQIQGLKTLVLFPASEASKLYPAVGCRYPHFSRVDLRAPDYQRFPKCRGAAHQSVTIRPGDLLYIPRRWWHFVRAEDPCISVNFWWLTLQMRLEAAAGRLTGRRN